MSERPGTDAEQAAEAQDGDEAELSAQERAALQAWRAPALSGALVARVLARRQEAMGAGAGEADREQPHGGRGADGLPAAGRRPQLVRWALVAAAAAAAMVTWQLARSPAGAVGAGAVTAQERLTRALGPRALGVLEPSTTLAWAMRGGRLEVEQANGNVFYRVDKGSAFVVRTPAGEVRVTGTCFRVEVLNMRGRQALVGGAVGAALAAALVVTVYEGGVVVAGQRGQTAVSAGQRRVTAGGEALSEADGEAVIALATAPPLDISREQLLARDAAQRRQLTALADKVTKLERALAAAPAAVARGAGSSTMVPDNDPTPEELAQWVKTCRVVFDFPTMDRAEPMQLSPEDAEAARLTAEEVAAANQVLAQQRLDWIAAVRKLYVEVVGEVADLEDRSLSVMASEIMEKGGTEAEESEVRRHLAQERAGLSRPPADLSKASAMERYLRGLAALGNEAEASLAKLLGPERARALRALHGGWGMRMSMDGCAGAGASERPGAAAR